MSLSPPNGPQIYRLSLKLKVSSIMQKTFNGLLKAGEDLINCALAATQRVRIAEAAGASQEELAHLRMLADSAYEAAVGYQCRASGLDKVTTH